MNGKLHLAALAAIAALTLPLVAIACGGGDDGEGTGGTPTGGAETTFDLAMGDNFFELAGEKNPTIAIPAGEEITINLSNGGVAIHNMRFPGDDNDYDTGDDAASDPALVTGGQEATLAFTAPAKAGTYDYRCDFHPTDMLGKFKVE
ncbi:MAG: plastocyanin/azurin family copper-binding protein [Dehalococcoidia bacterium]|nr:plastocyanin/azurin family copper-binding protein [Dehalococcoidia bacterium]